MTVLADASALISLFNTKDSNHTKAKTIFEKISPQDKLITSNFIFAETVTILSQRVGKSDSIRLGEYIKDTVQILRLTSEIEDLAWEIFKKQTDKNVSLVDCTSFALFAKGVYDVCFSFDSDFKSNQIPVLE